MPDSRLFLALVPDGLAAQTVSHQKTKTEPTSNFGVYDENRLFLSFENPDHTLAALSAGTSAGPFISLIYQDVDVILDLLQVKEKGAFIWPLVAFVVLPFSTVTTFSTITN
jgi:hypothetical protein